MSNRLALMWFVLLFNGLAYSAENVSVNIDNDKDCKKPKQIKLVKEKSVGVPAKEKPQVFQIEFKRDLISDRGTGFFVEKNGKKYAVTAEHNVGWNCEVRFFRINDEINVKLGKYHARSEKFDVAVFEVETDSEAYKLHKRLDIENISVIGEIYKQRKFEPIQVSIFGYPGSIGFRIVNGAVVQRYIPDKSEKDVSWLICNECGNSGMSGGPWVDDKTGKVVAVHTKSLGFNDSQGSGGAPVNIIHDLIDEIEEKHKKD